MFKRVRDLPPGTIGFEAVGRVDDDDFEEVVAPVLCQHIADGRKVRLLYLLGPQLDSYESETAQEELKFAARHATAYERVCVLSVMRAGYDPLSACFLFSSQKVAWLPGVRTRQCQEMDGGRPRLSRSTIDPWPRIAPQSRTVIARSSAARRK